MSTSCPFLSIIVPIYNCFGSLERCINSITNQTYQNIEIIAVDDGSSDGSDDVRAEKTGEVHFHRGVRPYYGRQTYDRHA